jgi:hypothetical protein
MSYRQTRIFAPPTVSFATQAWAETIIGCIIAPVIAEAQDLEWFWFSRYVCRAEGALDDCDIAMIPPDCRPPNRPSRSVKFRYSIADDRREIFEDQCQNRITNSGCCVSDFRPYEFLEDLGGDRHIGGERTEARRQNRAQLVAELYHSISRLVLDALVGPDHNGRFALEDNDNRENPLRSSFESLHHLFCSITGVPLSVLLSRNKIGTDWSHQPMVALTDAEQRVKLNF